MPTAQTFIDDKKVAQDAGPMGVNGIIGWYVPGWMAKEHPDITDWNNLNKYADLFKTSESGDKGQFLLGDPSYVSNDEAIIKNLGAELQGRGRRQRGSPDRVASSRRRRRRRRSWPTSTTRSGRGRRSRSSRTRWSRSTCRRIRPTARPTTEAGRLRLSGLRALQGRLDHVRRERRRRLRADQELQLDEPRPEHDGRATSTTRA